MSVETNITSNGDFIVLISDIYINMVENNDVPDSLLTNYKVLIDGRSDLSTSAKLRPIFRALETVLTDKVDSTNEKDIFALLNLILTKINTLICPINIQLIATIIKFTLSSGKEFSIRIKLLEECRACDLDHTDETSMYYRLLYQRFLLRCYLTTPGDYYDKIKEVSSELKQTIELEKTMTWGEMY